MSQEIYEKNIQSLLTINHQNLVRKLMDVDLNDQEQCIVFDGNLEGTKVLKVKKEESYILYNSFYNPYKEANELTKHIDYKINRSLITVVGVGMGYHLKEILDNLNNKSVILAVENNSIIMKNLLWHIDFSDAIANNKIFFALEDEETNVFEEISNITNELFLNIHSIQTVVLPILDLSYIKFSKKVLSYLSDLRNTYNFSLGNDLDDTIDGIVNRLHNLPHIIKNPGLKQFIETNPNVYKNKPAIIIASGPSLDNNIHLLSEVKGKALLLACDGSMESLKKHNIVPDVISSVERILLTYEAFYKGKQMPNDTVLAAPAVVRPEILNTFKNKTLSLFKNEPIASYFNDMVYDKGMVFSGTSVAHQLMGIAYALGADPIILVGQDLAYSSDGVSHTSEASVKEKVDIDKVNLYVKDINGQDVPTTFVWKQFKQLYEQYISSLDIECIDATEGGAYIEGTKIMTLREAIDNYCIEDIISFRKLVDALDVEESYILKAYEKSLKKIIRLAKKYNLLRLKSSKSKILNIQAQEMMDNGLKSDEELDIVYDALDYTEERIVKYVVRHPELTMFFQYPITLAVKEVNKLGSEYTLESIKSNLEIHQELLNIMEQYSLKMMHVLEDGFNYVKEKSLENTEHGDEIFNSILYPEFLKIQ